VARLGRAINVDEMIDSRKLSWFQIRVISLCVVIGMVDGFDTQSISFVARLMAGDLGLSINDFGAVFGAGNAGAFVGALTLPMLADRVGRKRMIILAVVLFGLFSFLNVIANSFSSLLAVRFLNGFGVGAALPSSIALATEYAPRRARAFLVTIVTSGFPMGAVAGGAISALMIPLWGWQSVFYLGGVAPLVLAAVLLVSLPESIRYLVSSDAPSNVIGPILKRIARDLTYTPNDSFVLPEAKFKGLPVKHLFTEGRAVTTLLIWFVYFMNLGLLFFIYSWLPPVLQQAGLSLSQAIVATVLFNLGGVVGGIALGRLSDRLGMHQVLIATYAVGAVFVAAIGAAGFSGPLIMAVVLLAGFCSIGVQTAVNPLTASLYPTLARGTGLGWAFGVGRIGSAVGPVVGGLLLSYDWSMRSVFLAAMTPPLSAGIAILLLKRIAAAAEAAPAAPAILPTRDHSDIERGSPPRMGIVGLEEMVFGVDEIDTCAAFFSDVGLDKVAGGKSGADFAVPGEGSQLRLRRIGDTALPRPLENGSSLREIVWGVAGKSELAAIAAELSRDRDVTEDAQGRLHVIGPDGVALAFKLTEARFPTQPLITPQSSRVDLRLGRSYARPLPCHLGHVGLFSPDIDAAAKFYADRLGFRISDRIKDFGVFLRGPGSIDHHNLFLIKRESPGLNHWNMRLADVDELGTGLTYLERRGWRPVWGIGRHYYGSHMFGFVDNPAGSFLEFTCDEDYILDDSKWQPQELDPRVTPMTFWGGAPPHELLTGAKHAKPGR
jgi:AAHS family 4-hydroxybenzoate transporter-like MFS transporter